MSDEEDKLFYDLLRKDPSPGKNGRLLRPDSKHISIPRWVTGDSNNEDYITISTCSLHKFFQKYNINSQILYDILELGLTDISQRPKCEVCGNPVKFGQLSVGYYKTCSNECHLKRTLSTRVTEESRKKAANTMIKNNNTWRYREFPESAKKKISDTLKRKYSSGELKISEENRESARQRMIGNKLSVGRVSPRKGVKLSQETKEKLSKKLKGRKLSKEHKKSLNGWESKIF